MEIKGLFMALLALSVVLLGIGAVISSMFTQYGQATPTTVASSGTGDNIYQRINSTTQGLENSLMQNQITGINIIDVPFMIANGAYTTLKVILFDLPTLMVSLIGVIGASIGMAGWVIAIAITAVVLTVVFAIIKGILKVTI